MRFTHCMAAALAVALPAAAAEVNVIGLFPGKAVVVINGAAPRTLSVGQKTPEGVTLLAADSKAATFDVDGKREVIGLGQAIETPAIAGSRQSVTFASDASGHFSVDGQVNGGTVRFLVDTGATLVTLPASEALRLGIDFKRGQPAVSQTANGRVLVYRIRLDAVSVGGMVLNGVDAAVHDSPGLEVSLLGMSFLNRTEMRREGGNLTLTKRY